MCGIIGILAYGAPGTVEEENKRREIMIYLATEMLQLTESRGKDATGITTLFNDGDFIGLKMGVSATNFVSRFGGTRNDYEGYLKLWRNKNTHAKVVLGHCRKPSLVGVATTDDNANNHPIKVGKIVGIHNGTLKNEDKIFENLKCKRDGKVDSEAIFRLLDHLTKNGTEPFTPELVQETCRRIHGGYAVIAFNGNNPFQAVAFRDGRPMEFVSIPSLKLLLIASEKDVLDSVLFRYNKMALLYAAGFSHLKQKDVNYITSADDSLYVFNLTHEMNAESRPEDLYHTEKVSRTNKIWGVSSTYNTETNTQYGNRGWQQQVDEKKTGGKDTGQTQTTTCKNKPKQDTKDRIGMAFNVRDSKYESVFKIEDTDTHGNVELCVGKPSSVLEQEKKYTDRLAQLSRSNDTQLEQGSSTQTCLMKSDGSGAWLEEILEVEGDDQSNPAVIKEIIVKESEKLPVKVKNDIKQTQIKEVVVDMGVYPDVFTSATEAARNIKNMKNDEELMDTVGIKNIVVLRTLSLSALANKVKFYFYSKGWYNGYVSRLKEENSPIDTNDVARRLLIKSRDKAKKSQDTIRNLKTLVEVLSNTTDTRSFESKISEALSSGKEINPEIISKVFTEGNLKTNESLRKMIGVLSEKKERIAKTTGV